MTASTETERVEFEASVKKLFDQFVERDFNRHCDNYKYEGTQMLWELWQSARRAQVVPTDLDIAELRSKYGITSNGYGIHEFEKVANFTREALKRWSVAPQSPGAAPLELPE